MSTVKGIALITGASQGIGRGIALRLAKDGFDIALNDVSSKHDQLRTVADGIEQIGRRALLVPGDVTVEEDVKGMVQGASEQLGGLDVMVANAGIGGLAPLISTELDDWERTMATNARGPFLCYKFAAQQMIKQGRGGRIIGASSVAGKSAVPLASAYAASKFAVRGLTQTAALELGKYNITVNSYAPGLVDTPMTTDFVHGNGVPVIDADPELLSSLSSRMNSGSIKHIGQPGDIASLVSYLVSREAHWITGQCIAIDGGISLS